jgi:DNA primase
MRSGHFERGWLPDPLAYFADAGLPLVGRGAWRSALCCFHDDTRPSLSVNIESGGYVCHGCGAKGGDVLDFHRARYGLSFTQAARELGAMR